LYTYRFQYVLVNLDYLQGSCAWNGKLLVANHTAYLYQKDRYWNRDYHQILEILKAINFTRCELYRHINLVENMLEIHFRRLKNHDYHKNPLLPYSRIFDESCKVSQEILCSLWNPRFVFWCYHALWI
jgi:hypothetical protein